MDDKKMIDDFVKMMDSGMAQGVGHVNVEVDDEAQNSKNVQTMGCTDCSRWPAVFQLSMRGWMILNNTTP